MCLEGGQAVLVAKDGQQVVAEWVGYVLGPVGVGALSSHQALDGKALQTRLPVKTGSFRIPGNAGAWVAASKEPC